MVKVSIYIVVYSSTVRPLVSQPLAGTGDRKAMTSPMTIGGDTTRLALHLFPAASCISWRFRRLCTPLLFGGML